MRGPTLPTRGSRRYQIHGWADLDYCMCLRPPHQVNIKKLNGPAKPMGPDLSRCPRMHWVLQSTCLRRLHTFSVPPKQFPSLRTGEAGGRKGKAAEHGDHVSCLSEAAPVWGCSTYLHEGRTRVPGGGELLPRWKRLRGQGRSLQGCLSHSRTLCGIWPWSLSILTGRGRAGSHRPQARCHTTSHHGSRKPSSSNTRG